MGRVTAIFEQDGIMSVEFKKTSVSKETNGINGRDGVKRVANGSNEGIDRLSKDTTQNCLILVKAFSIGDKS